MKKIINIALTLTLPCLLLMGNWQSLSAQPLSGDWDRFLITGNFNSERLLSENFYKADKPERLSVNYESEFNYRNLLLVSPLIAYGVTAQFALPLDNLDLNIKRSFQNAGIRRFHADDFIQLTPYAAVYAFELFGCKPKNNLLDRTFLMASTVSIMGLSIVAIKNITKVLRPDGSAHNSFPSGHTATAFAGAHILFKEYKDVSPWIGIGGYAVATSVGVMRMMNQRHWFSDVVMGSGIGIISAEVGYLILPAFQKVTGKKLGGKVAFSPYLSNDGMYGISLVKGF